MEPVPSDIVDGRAYELDIAPVIERDELVIRPVDMPVNSGEHFDIFFDQVVCFCAGTLRVRDSSCDYTHMVSWFVHTRPDCLEQIKEAVFRYHLSIIFLMTW
jgi:hypothetical protein